MNGPRNGFRSKTPEASKRAKQFDPPFPKLLIRARFPSPAPDSGEDSSSEEHRGKKRISLRMFCLVGAADLKFYEYSAYEITRTIFDVSHVQQRPPLHCYLGRPSFNRVFVYLKRFLSILSDLILDSSVDRGTPNFAAAPVGPNTRPRLAFRASSIRLFSCASSLRGSSMWRFDSVAAGGSGNQLSSIENISVSQRITERSITFCNSRMFPGQGYD